MSPKKFTAYKNKKNISEIILGLKIEDVKNEYILNISVKKVKIIEKKKY